MDSVAIPDVKFFNFERYTACRCSTSLGHRDTARLASCTGVRRVDHMVAEAAQTLDLDVNDRRYL